MNKGPAKYVILAWDGNPAYSGFWRYVSRHWFEKFGVEPVLTLVHNERWNPTFEVLEGQDLDFPHHIFPVLSPAGVPSGYLKDFRTTVALLYAAAKFGDPSAVRFIAGIDQILLSPEVLRYGFDLPDEALRFAFRGAYPQPSHASPDWTYEPDCFVFGTGLAFRETCGIAHMEGFPEFCRRVWEGRSNWPSYWGATPGDLGWGLDESFLSYHASYWTKSAPLRKGNFFHDFVVRNRIDRENGVPQALDINRLKEYGYSEFHALRPFSANPDWFVRAIQEHLPPIAPPYEIPKHPPFVPVPPSGLCSQARGSVSSQ